MARVLSAVLALVLVVPPGGATAQPRPDAPTAWTSAPTLVSAVDTCARAADPCGPLPVRWGAREGSASYGDLGNGTQLAAVCQVRTAMVSDGTGYQSDIWTMVELTSGRDYGFVPDTFFGRRGFALWDCANWQGGTTFVGTADTCDWAPDPCSGVYVRREPQQASEIFVELPQGSQRTSICSTPGQPITSSSGYKSNVWHYVEWEAGRFGWVADVWWGRRGLALNDCYDYTAGIGQGGQPNVSSPSVTVAPTSGTQGTLFRGGGTSFTPGASAQLVFFWPSGGRYPITYERPIAADGSFYWQWVWEPGDELGTYRMEAYDPPTGRMAALTFTIQEGSTPTPPPEVPTDPPDDDPAYDRECREVVIIPMPGSGQADEESAQFYAFFGALGPGLSTRDLTWRVAWTGWRPIAVTPNVLNYVTPLYADSVVTGMGLLREAIDRERFRPCAQPQKIVIWGYSQGAQVVGNIVDQYPALGQSVAAAVLLADPRYNPNHSTARGRNSMWEGIVFQDVRAGTPAPEWGDRAGSFCHNFDVVCAFANPLSVPWVHTGYPIDSFEQIESANHVTYWLDRYTAPDLTSYAGAADAAPPVADVEAAASARPGEVTRIGVWTSTSPSTTVDHVEWDLDADQTFEHSTAQASLTTAFPDEGDWTISARVVDTAGQATVATTTLRIDASAPARPSACTDLAVDDRGDNVVLQWRASTASTTHAYTLRDAQGEVAYAGGVVGATATVPLGPLEHRRHLVLAAVVPLNAAGAGAACSVATDISPATPAGLPPGRTDGGGSADPVGQAIATSQLLFADGAVSRVVLATSDRFPDALAGAALAGDDGPILLTPTDAPLDPRVEAEIERVTGSAGVVLTLGGTAAITEEAASAAVDAAGGNACTAPLPASCRYAGTGREHTAALVARTVIAEHPGDRVLVARGDVFADAITGGAYAARTGTPLLLTPPDLANVDTLAFLAQYEPAEVVVLGGEAAVDASTAAELGATERIAGLERTATSAAIATLLWRRDDGERGIVLINVAHPAGWQTALAAAVASAVHGAPQLGVHDPPADLSDQVVDVLQTSSGPLHVFGSETLVSEQQRAQALEALA